MRILKGSVGRAKQGLGRAGLECHLLLWTMSAIEPAAEPVGSCAPELWRPRVWIIGCNGIEFFARAKLPVSRADCICGIVEPLVIRLDACK
jgi:hypothetical protein